MKAWAAAIGLAVATVLALRAQPTPGPADELVVVYRSGDASSEALANYYAQRRGIPAGRVLGLPCPGAEEISREEFLVTIEAPLREAFERFGWWQVEPDFSGARMVRAARIRFLAVMRGVPMKIRPSSDVGEADRRMALDQPGPLASRNDAAVDSELATLFLRDRHATGVMPNPYYRSFAAIGEVPPAESPLLVARLDGPDDATVRRMIDDSLAAERDGLWGWAYLDARGIAEGAYATGDRWILAAGERMRRQGIPVIEDRLPATLEAEFPVRDAAVYYGWYEGSVNGPFARAGRIFVPGGIAVHLHSFSASTIRDAGAAWAAPLLARGAAATFGNVYEPYLEFTVNFDVLQDRLMAGLTLAEAGYAAMRGVSWMGVVIGDPLYRPYATWLSLDPHRDGGLWSRYRAVVLQADGPLAAARSLDALARRERSSMPLEALAQAQAAGGDFAEALATLRAALALEKSPAVRLRLVLEQVEILRRGGRNDEARSVVVEALDELDGPDARGVLGRLAASLAPPPPRAPVPSAP